MVGNVDIARISPHIAHGDPGVGALRVGIPNRQGGEIHGLELGEQGLSPSGAKVHVQRDGRSVCDAAEAGLPVVGRLIQRLPALAVIYRVGEPPQVDAASEVGLHLQHGASGEAQRPRVGERDGAVGVGQPSPAAANAEGAAPLQQAVPQADGLIGEVLQGPVGPGGALVGVHGHGQAEGGQQQGGGRKGGQVEARGPLGRGAGQQGGEGRHHPPQHQGHQGQPAWGDRDAQGEQHEGEGADEDQPEGAQAHDAQPQQGAQRYQGQEDEQGGAVGPEGFGEGKGGLQGEAQLQAGGNGVGHVHPQGVGP